MDNLTIQPAEIGARIRKLRQKQGKTQVYFADSLYISPSYLALIEAGKRTPTLEVLVQIASISDVSIDYLIFGDDSSLDTVQKTFDRLRSVYPPDRIQKALQLAEFYLTLDEERK